MPRREEGEHRNGEPRGEGAQLVLHPLGQRVDVGVLLTLPVDRDEEPEQDAGDRRVDATRMDEGPGHDRWHGQEDRVGELAAQEDSPRR